MSIEDEPGVQEYSQLWFKQVSLVRVKGIWLDYEGGVLDKVSRYERKSGKDFDECAVSLTSEYA